MSFQVKKYTIQTNKLKTADSISIVFLSDLHLAEYGRGNTLLIEQIRSLQPDLILSGGDMVIGSEGHSVEQAVYLLCTLAKEFPVYAALGNHEKRMKEKTSRFGNLYQEYQSKLEAGGVCVLDNTHKAVAVRQNQICIHGLSLPLQYYRKLIRQYLSLDVVKKCLGEAEKGQYHLLLAHHPRFADTYFEWGADLILSGHIHGGVMRLGKRAVISPDVHIFPKYGYGRFFRGQQELLISAGLGEHTMPFRLFNPKELLYIEIKQEVSHGDSR